MVIVDQPADRTLVLTRLFDAPRDVVFSAWTEPERAAKWWGPKGFIILSCAMDVRRGGVYRIQMQSPNGTFHTKRGIYQDILPPEWLVFTWAWEDEQGVSRSRNPGDDPLRGGRRPDQADVASDSLRNDIAAGFAPGRVDRKPGPAQ